MTDRPTAVLIAGPTASGKSALAIEIARRTGGAIVNADSMQVYDGLRIVTARPGQADLMLAEHCLYGHVDPGEAWSVARWLGDVGSLLDRLDRKGRPAIFVGGTGLYFSALERGLSQIPAPVEAIRQHWRSVAAAAPGTLHEELARRDPVGASALVAGDVQRLVRALEVIDSTGLPIHHWRRIGRQEALLAGRKVQRFILEPPRMLLHERIGRRFDAMIAEGAIDEVAAFLQRRDLRPDLPVMKAIGLRELGEFIRGNSALEAAAERAKAATRQFAKRQSTWFRGQFDSSWMRSEEARLIARATET